MTHSLHTTMLSFPLLAEAVGSTQRRFLQRFPLAATTLLRLHMSLMCWAPGVHAGCTALCTPSLHHHLSQVVLSLASRSSSLAPLKTHLGAFPSQNQSIIQLNLAVLGSLTLLGPEMKKRMEKRDHWFFGTRHQDGMSSYSVGASISVEEWLLRPSRISSWFLQHSQLLVRQHQHSLLSLIMTRSFCSLVRLARICSPWITVILCPLFRLLPSAWAASTLSWHVNRRKRECKKYIEHLVGKGFSFLGFSRMRWLYAITVQLIVDWKVQ